MSYISGPWHVTRDYDGSRMIAELRDYRRDGLKVEAAMSWIGGSSPEQLDANACLIAAAPDLFEAAKAALEFVITLHPSLVDFTAIKSLDAAIAKAEGRT